MLLAFNPFKLLNIEPQFDISEETLLQNYQALMKKLHPDQFLTQPEKEWAMIQSSQINEAYEILKAPLKRAEALLNILEVSIEGLDFETLESLMLLQEENDKQKIHATFQKAETDFAHALKNKDLEMMKTSFLIMKYLKRSQESGVRS